MANVPDVDEVRAWLDVSAETGDDVLEDIVAGELANQVRACRMPAGWPEDPDLYPADLRLAHFRRCGRAVAARGIPLGMLNDTEYGPTRLSRWDAEIERYERPLRRFVAG